jgi:hypothetical protein
MSDTSVYPAASAAERSSALSRLDTCVATFRKWLHMPDPGALYVTLATIAANRAPGDPLWLLLVGPPGGGKTEVIQSLSGQPDVHAAATLTEGALLSGVPKRDRASDAKGGLLRQIGDFGILLHKDFGSVLSMNRDARSRLLAALREIYDGSWTRHVGTDGGRTLAWSGKVGLIAGCTPAIDSHHAVMGSMGERFILYRMPSVDAEDQARRGLANVGHETPMRKALGMAVDTLLSLVDASTSRWDAPAVERLVQIAALAARCRSPVERDSYGRDIVLIPPAEAPARLAQGLMRILNGLRAIGVNDNASWHLVAKCALDSMPAVRLTVLEDLGLRGTSSTTEIAARTGYPTTTTRRTLEDLAAHALVERHVEGAGLSDLWQMSPWTRDRWPGIPEMSVDSAEAPVLDGNGDPVPVLTRIEVDKTGTLFSDWDLEGLA